MCHSIDTPFVPRRGDPSDVQAPVEFGRIVHDNAAEIYSLTSDRNFDVPSGHKEQQ